MDNELFNLPSLEQKQQLAEIKKCNEYSAKFGGYEYYLNAGRITNV